MVNSSNLSHYVGWLKTNYELHFNDYEELWQWSIDHLSEFWKSLWEYFDIQADGDFSRVMPGTAMPAVSWFEGTKLNYAEHIFRNRPPDQPAILWASEQNTAREITWNELRKSTASFQNYLRDLGVKKGDRVVGYLPCIPEATVAFLAANSIGAVWSSCSPDFGAQSVIDRFAQIEPKVLVAIDTYCYGGKKFDKLDVVEQVRKAIPSIESVVIISSGGKFESPYISWKTALSNQELTLTFARVPFNHPIWVLYSSGTTGMPKAITHSHGGILLEQFKYTSFHNDVKPGERCFWYTTTGWMMWNYIHGSLLCGAAIILYDGSPAYPDLNVLWQLAQDTRMNHFGTSAGFILANMKAQTTPGKSCNHTLLRSIGSTGSTLPPEGFQWIYENVKPNLWLASMSGGTDVCSAFVGGNPNLPVYKGEIQCRTLGCALFAFDEQGNSIEGQVGEMVITHPMPSMPIYFWNDPGQQKYIESYFEMYPGIWRQGDWIEITKYHGVVIYGRSDATLNRGGVRIGTSEIYRAVDQVKEIKDSLILCIEKERGEFYMPLFVLVQEGVVLDDSLKNKINTAIRNAYSPRHVPDEIIEAPDIPYTISGKKTEPPIKKILMGKDPEKVVNKGALRNPKSLQFYIDFYHNTLKTHK
jgi:acetoacetyl-CoA synthetase